MTVLERFRQSLFLGTGEANLILQTHPGLNVYRSLKNACLTTHIRKHYLDSRPEYLARLVDLTDRKEEIIDAVVARLGTEVENVKSLSQLFDLAGIFAREGSARARQAIYDRVEANLHSDDHIGYSEIASIDGIEGIVWVAELLGNRLQNDPDHWEDSLFITQMNEHHPEFDVWNVLNRHARKSEAVRRYMKDVRKDLQRIRARQNSRSTRFPPVLSLDEVHGKIEKQWRPYIARSQTIPADVLLQLAYEFLQEQDWDRKSRYLRIFNFASFPLDYRPILEIAAGPDRHVPFPHLRLLVAHACDALGLLTGKDIRQLALQKLKDSRSPYRYVPLLNRNYRNADARLLRELVESAITQGQIHGWASNLIELYSINSTPTCREPLLSLYPRLTCGYCRHKILGILHSHDLLPARIIREMEFDADEDTRRLFAEITGTGQEVSGW